MHEAQLLAADDPMALALYLKHLPGRLYDCETSPWRQCHSTQSLTVIGCQSLGIYTLLISLAVIAVIFCQNDRVVPWLMPRAGETLIKLAFDDKRLS
jgi:hypothetical protein